MDETRRAVALLAGARYSENSPQRKGCTVWSAKLPQQTAGRTRPKCGTRVLANCTFARGCGRILHARGHTSLPVLAICNCSASSEEEVVRRTRRYYRGPLQIGQDLMVVEIQNEVQIRSTPSDGPRSSAPLSLDDVTFRCWRARDKNCSPLGGPRLRLRRAFFSQRAVPACYNPALLRVRLKHCVTMRVLTSRERGVTPVRPRRRSSHWHNFGSSM